ncbi:hypothetical protein M513_13463 [Trichuris suis]|uniref:Uncharacterized protein n=1 Tax=Trichuris suis TaxID=68888 RepID=A0A085LL14_9BILA|nr:hypothetical protein M513_13463 [Trichuris suis]
MIYRKRLPIRRTTRHAYYIGQETRILGFIRLPKPEEFWIAQVNCSVNHTRKNTPRYRTGLTRISSGDKGQFRISSTKVGLFLTKDGSLPVKG